MEGRAHSQKHHRPADSISRIVSDLSSCFQGSKSSGKPAAQAMIRRVLPRSTSRRPPHVCVVGAGMAGLRCAEVLVNGGVQVTVLEGRDQIGGRVGASAHE